MARRIPTLPAPLTRAVRRFEKWRKSGKKRRIPASLWALATRLGGKYGINRTAVALRLDYYDLKGRVEDAARAPASEPVFVEVTPTSEASPRECLVELEDPRGVKMKIQLKAAGEAELAALGRLFWRQEA